MARVVPRTVTEQVYVQVRESIQSGSYVPGSRIDQAAIARHFGASLVPVREALARLQADGLVEIIPHRGAFVADLEQDELLDIYATRELLEQEAARIAAPRLGDADLAHLADLLAQMRGATEQSDYAALFTLNRDFHFTIYAAADRQHLQQIISQLWDKVDHHRRVYTEVSHRARLALEEHHAIYDACRRRDPDALGYAMRHHIHQTTVGLQEFLEGARHSKEAELDDQRDHSPA